MPTITTNDGVRLNYRDEGDGRPVVCVAGFTAPATSWQFQRDPLIAAGYRVLALDRRFHGASEKSPDGNRMSRHGKDLDDFLTSLNLVDTVLLGGSMGASTVWAYLDLFGARRIKAVVTVDQTPKMENTDDWPHGFYGYRADNLGSMFAAGIPQTGRGTPVDQRMARLQRVIAAMGLTPEDLARPVVLPPGQLALLRDHAVQDWRDVISHLEVPALFVAGRDSEVWPSTHAVAAAALNPSAESVVIEDCGHAANLEQPEEFNRILLEFLARV